MLEFGVTVLPDPPHTRLVELMQLAERHGFQYGWTYDSHVLWQEGMVLLTLMAAGTEKLKLGHCVTNPGTREPTVLASGYATLQDVSGGRMVMGIGRGDSARRVIGQQPVKMAEFESACRMIFPFAAGESAFGNPQGPRKLRLGHLHRLEQGFDRRSRNPIPDHLDPVERRLGFCAQHAPAAQQVLGGPKRPPCRYRNASHIYSPTIANWQIL